MDIYEYYQWEKFFVEVYRHFNFLILNQYTGESFNLNGPEFWMYFESYRHKRRVEIVLAENFDFKVRITRTNLFSKKTFEVKEVCEYFDCGYLKHLEYSKEIQANAVFIQQHLIPIITGEKWIDEMVKM
jgi:hypothetical protein